MIQTLSDGGSRSATGTRRIGGAVSLLFLFLVGCTVPPAVRLGAGTPADTAAPPGPPTSPPAVSLEQFSAPGAETEIEDSLAALRRLLEGYRPDTSGSGGQLDFALAFAETAQVEQAVKPSPPAQEAVLPSCEVPSRLIRVALKRAAPLVTVCCAAAMKVRGGTAVRGRLQIAKTSRGADLRTDGGLRPVALPCTLQSTDGAHFLESDNTGYRGMMLAAAEGGGITLVNLLDVEDYLRGVVPLEIGTPDSSAAEAVRAQAVAARTYAYNRMLVNRANLFDVLPTVEDQVYGGVPAETGVGDRAVESTRDLVLTYNNALINAYYHSTCGGRTANVEDVWDQPPTPYLRSMADTGPDGRPYCAASPSFDWEEQWTPQVLVSILKRFLPQTCQTPFNGALRGLRVTSRSGCGRVRELTIRSSEGAVQCNGDKTRFVLRRNIPGYPILRSDNFTIAADRHIVRIRGKGYGHGVGMCQMGAIGRARAGQRFDQILAAYYAGTALRLVVAGDGGR